MDLIYSGGGDPRAEISAMIQAIEAAGGGRLTIVGEHVVDPIQAPATNLDIDMDQGKLTLRDGASQPALLLYAPVRSTGRLRMFSPHIDCSRGQYRPAALSSSAVVPLYYARVEIFGGVLDGGDRAGDSGISPQNVVSGLIRGTAIRGFGDLGIYVTGELGTTMPADSHIQIENVQIRNCRNGVDSKRGYPLVTVKNCTFTDCDTALLQSWVSNAGESALRPGLRMDVVGGSVRGSKVAFQPEGGARMSIDGTSVTKTRRVLGNNKGGTLAGRCRVASGSKKILNRNHDVGGKTYRPQTALKILAA